ncbi:MAG: MFS transporter [Alphaproteobacteria bacterium]|nr:MFS transporter [Alphaproteobacteria bacterium]
MREQRQFYGWRVVGAAFVLGIFGWGLGFYGPPIYLQTICATRGWPVALVSAAVTLHYLTGAAVVANLPRFYRRFGVAAVTRAGAFAAAGGVAGWALAAQPWQLFAAVLVSGAGWVTLSGAAINAIVSPWFVRRRPVALSAAYNGASVGGVIFSPLWVAAIAALGFPAAAGAIGAVAIVTVWLLAGRYFAVSPAQLGMQPDGDPPAATHALPRPAAAEEPLPVARLWRDRRFLTLAAGFALSLFAQVGLLAHLFSLLVPTLGDSNAGLAAGGATGVAIAARMWVGRRLDPGRDRRLFACGNYMMQATGAVALLVAAGGNVPLLLIGVVLVGAGIGNTTSLPPLIAQADFAAADVARVVPLVIAVSQACAAFAPAAFGLLRGLAPTADAAGIAPLVFAAAALLYGAAILALLAGRRPPQRSAAGRRADVPTSA